MWAKTDRAQGVLAITQTTFAHFLAHALADVLANIGLHMAVLHVDETAWNVNRTGQNLNGGYG